MAIKPLRESEQALRDAYKAGDREAMKLAAREVLRGRAALERSLQNIRDDMAREQPGGTVLEGYGAGALNVLRRGARLALPKHMEKDLGFLTGDRGTLDEAIAEQERLDSKGSGRFQGGKFLGEMVTSAPAAGAAGAGVRAVGAGLNAANKAGALSRLASYGAEGALGASLTADDVAAQGAGLNMLLTPLMNRGGRLLRATMAGVRRSKDADVLLRHGAKLDLGQMNPGSWADRAIKAAESAPLGAGAAIRGNREAALRPVIPNLAADMAGAARPGAVSARRGVNEALEHVENKFGVLDQTPLAPRIESEVAAGRFGASQAGRRGRETGRDYVAEHAGKLDDAEKMASANVLMNKAALQRRGLKPEVRAALKLKEGVLDARLGQAQITKGRYNPSAAERNFYGHKAVEGFRSDLQNDLLKSARTKYLPRSERRKVEKALGEHLSKLSDKDLSPAKLKAIASSLKAQARNFKTTKSPTEETRRLARAYNRAAQWFEGRIEESISDAGGNLGAYQQANRQFGALQPLVDATAKTGATSHGLVNPTLLEKALQRDMGKRAWLAGKGGAPRDVAEALKRLQMSQWDQGGALQASSLPSQLLRAVQGTVGIPLSGRLIGAVARGEHALGRTLRKAENTRGGRLLVNALEGLRPGVVPAMVESNEDE